MKSHLSKLLFLFVTIYLAPSNSIHAQSILARNISLNIVNQPLGKVMDLMQEKGAFGFSYYSKIVPRDSIVNIQIENVTIKEALDRLLNERYEYKETKNFVILRYAPLRLSMVTDRAWGDKNLYTINGYVIDEHSGKRLHNASVYEKNLAQGTLTDENGHFEIKLRDIYQPIALTVSKENYKNVTTFFLSEVTVRQKPKRTESDYDVGDFEDIANTRVADLFTSAKQRIQSLNLGGIISEAPYQVSLVPSLNSHGAFSGQIVNDISLSLIGGYSAGTNGVEIGGIYNINKINAQGFQLAGLFNSVGGKVKGVQLAGLYNDISGEVNGIQLAGIENNVRGSRKGVQLAGIFNNVKRNSSGIQLAGLFNAVHGKASGIQIAGLFNQVGNFDGVQIGLFNIAKSSSGYSLGLLNFIGDGYNKVSLGYNETINLNFALKTGTQKLYTMWLGGMNVKKDEKLYAFGLGLGSAINIANWLSINPEISCRYLYQGNWKDRNLLNRFDLGFNFKIADGFAITTGPSANILYTNQDTPIDNYAYVQNRVDKFKLNNSKLRGWIGWGAAITIF